MRAILFTTISLCLIFTKTSAQNELKTGTFIPSYRSFGEGAPILIINGGPGMNSNGFAEVAKSIASLGYQTIIFDQRGTGNSKLEEVSANTITMELMVEDIENLRRSLKIDKWIVLGHSFGGLLACSYYARHPENIQKLVFSSSGGVNMHFTQYVSDKIQGNLTQVQRDSLGYYQRKMSQGDTSRHTLRKRAHFLANAYVYNKAFAPLIAGRLMEVNFAINGLVFQDLRKINYDYTNKFKDRDIPVLVIQGKNDVISIETAQEIKESFGHARLVLLDNCAHYGWLDAPEQYFKTLEIFLKG